MRASKTAVAAAACLLASVIAEQSFVDSGDFRRELHTKTEANFGHDKYVFRADDPTVPIATEYPNFSSSFNNAPGTYGAEREQSTTWIGIIIGFVCTGVFIIFSLTWVIIDECNRHESFTEQIKKDKELLKREYGKNNQDWQGYENDFEIFDAKNADQLEEEERAEMGKIN